MTTRIDVERWLAEPGAQPAMRNVRLAVGEGAPQIAPGAGQGKGLLAMPAPVNAHDHGLGVRTMDFDCMDDALEPWIAGLRLRPPTDPYLEALVAFGRMLKSGCCATMHLHNSLNADRLGEEAAEVIRAARDSGIRMGLSCPLLDTSPWIYGEIDALRGYVDEGEWQALAALVPRYRPIGEQIEAVLAIARDNAASGVDVQLGPIGPQWASNALLERIADASRSTGLRVHMHLLESPRQRLWLDRRFPQGVVAYLDSIGFLSPRLAVAHGVHLRPEECELLAERGVIVVTNPSANLRLRSGVAPLDALRRAGVDFAIGMDGTVIDDDQDIWREMRLAHLLHGGRGIDPAADMAEMFRAATVNGAAVVNRPTGGDVVVIDYGELTRDALFDDLDEARVIMGRMTARHVRELFVAGRHVVADGEVAGFDFEAARSELHAQARAALPRLEAERGNARRIADLVRRYYRSWQGQAGET